MEEFTDRVYLTNNNPMSKIRQNRDWNMTRPSDKTSKFLKCTIHTFEMSKRMAAGLLWISLRIVTSTTKNTDSKQWWGFIGTLRVDVSIYKQLSKVYHLHTERYKWQVAFRLQSCETRCCVDWPLVFDVMNWKPTERNIEEDYTIWNNKMYLF